MLDRTGLRGCCCAGYDALPVVVVGDADDVVTVVVVVALTISASHYTSKSPVPSLSLTPLDWGGDCPSVRYLPTQTRSGDEDQQDQESQERNRYYLLLLLYCWLE